MGMAKNWKSRCQNDHHGCVKVAALRVTLLFTYSKLSIGNRRQEMSDAKKCGSDLGHSWCDAMVPTYLYPLPLGFPTSPILPLSIARGERLAALCPGLSLLPETQHSDSVAPFLP